MKKIVLVVVAAAANLALCAQCWDQTTTNPYHIYTAYTTSGTCPTQAAAVGVGLDLTGFSPTSKFNLFTRDFGIGGDIFVDRPQEFPDIYGFKIEVKSDPNDNSGYNSRTGLFVLSEGDTDLGYGVHVVTDGTSGSATAGLFKAIDNAVYSKGVMGHSEVAESESIGIYGLTTAEAEKNYGVNGTAHAQSENGGAFYGVAGFASTQATSQTAYAVYGEAPYNIGYEWACYFEGATYSTDVAWNASDEKMKTNILNLNSDSSVAELKRLQPKEYSYNIAAYPNFGLPSTKRYGFLAQDFEKLYPDWVTTIRTEGNSNGKPDEFKAMHYGGIVPLLVSVTQNQQENIENLVAITEKQAVQIDVLETALENVLSRLENLEAKLLEKSERHSTAGLKHVDLTVSPNPFDETTTITFTLRDDASVRVAAVDGSGKTVETILNEHLPSGDHSLQWSAVNYPANTFYITLYIDQMAVMTRAVKTK